MENDNTGMVLGVETASEISANQLYNHLYEACNILRGPINQDDYKSYVIPILFFKRISDVYDEETAEAEERYGEDVAFYTEEELHAFSIPAGAHWQDVRQTSEDVGTAIVSAMMAIEQANPDTLAGLFSSSDDANWTDKTKLTDERLKNLIEHMSAIRVGNRDYSADVMGDAYEFLIKKFADMSKKNAGEFYTPRSIVKLMVRLLQPKSGESVYEKTLPTLIQTNETKKSTQIDAFFESKPKIDAFLKIDANAQSRNTKWHPDQRLWKQDAIFICFFIQSGDTPAMQYIPADTSLVFLRFPWHRIDDGRKYQLLPGGRSIVARDHGVSRAQSDASARGQSFHKQNNS